MNSKGNEMDKPTFRDLIFLMLAVLASLFVSALVLYWLVQILAFMWRLT